ncbi:MAG TPA: hypothetical protein VEG38_00225 [Acidimicrobiia bacterium]|nr:hypothetical protein [Acidimicrobiia bacterium]
MAETELPGHETADVAAGRELPVARVGAAEELDAVAGRVEAVHHPCHPAVFQLGLRALGDGEAGRLEVTGGGVEGGGVRHLPSGAAAAGLRCGFNRDAVVAVIHSQVDDVALARHELHTEHRHGEAGPVVRIFGGDPEVTE